MQVKLDQDVLLCPHCGFNFMHHGRIDIFDRVEDDERTFVVSVDHSATSNRIEKSANVNNPSTRRHGLTIEFSCEGCNKTSVLALAQHKGNTYLTWR